MKYLCVFCTILLFSCTSGEKSPATRTDSAPVSLIILGNVQDAGSPHIACQKECCGTLFENPDPQRKVVALGVVDRPNAKSYLFEATPDLPEQVKILKQYSGLKTETPDGVFLTHAHIGHYAGLMYFGKEAMNATEISTYAMPRMHDFLTNNGPWGQLVKNKNILLHSLADQQELTLTSQVRVVPLLVPHRDEYSETLGYKIIGPTKSALFIPDIDKWSKWKTSIIEQVKQVDYAFLDATFYDGAEINNRDISEIPHPFVIESMQLFDSLESNEKRKIYFIHMNHTNPLLNIDSDQSRLIIEKGFNVARFKDVFDL